VESRRTNSFPACPQCLLFWRHGIVPGQPRAVLVAK
jgi:hypothetical protein